MYLFLNKKWKISRQRSIWVWRPRSGFAEWITPINNKLQLHSSAGQDWVGTESMQGCPLLHHIGQEIVTLYKLVNRKKDFNIGNNVSYNEDNKLFGRSSSYLSRWENLCTGVLLYMELFIQRDISVVLPFDCRTFYFILYTFFILTLLFWKQFIYFTISLNC